MYRFFSPGRGFHLDFSPAARFIAYRLWDGNVRRWHSVRIIIVDDNPEALFVIENFLKTVGHSTAAFTDGREALLWLKDFKPELILSDLSMPGMDGFDFVRHVRAMAAYSSVPVVCITGTDASDEQISSRGFAAVLRKPVTLSHVLDAVALVEQSANSST